MHGPPLHVPPRAVDQLGRIPDPVDLKRDHALLEKYGLTRGNLIDRMGGSP
jgi:hypothetical protein